MSGAGRARGRAAGRSNDLPAREATPGPGGNRIDTAPPRPQTAVPPGAGYLAAGSRDNSRGNSREGSLVGASSAVATESTATGAIPRGGLAPPRGAGARPRMDIQTLIARNDERRARLVSSIVTPYTRPEKVKTGETKGSQGVPVDLVTNFFRIQGGPSWAMFEYHVDFEPEIDSLKLRRDLVRVHKEKIGETYSFNGANLITPMNLGESFEWISQNENDGTAVKLKVKRTAEVSPDSDEAVRILDTVIRQMQLTLNLKQSRRDFFDPEAEFRLENHGLAIWPGYAMTITKYENELLLNMDIIHRVLRTDTVLDVMSRLQNDCKKNNMNFKEMLEKELIGQVVLTKYNNKTHTIDDILFPPHNTPMSTFERKGETITIKDYMRIQYGEDIKVANQPLLVTRPRKVNRRLNEGVERVDKLVPELCYMTGLSDAQRADFRLMKEFGEQTRLPPQLRLQRYMAFGNRVENCEAAKKMLKNWNLKLHPQPLRVQGRQLPPVELTMGAGQKVMPDARSAEWDRSVKTMKALDPGALTNWVICYGQRDEVLAKELSGAFLQVASSLGMQTGPPKPLMMNRNSAHDYKQACQQAASLPGCRLIVCLLGRKDRATYEAIKKYTLVDVGIPSQCVCVNTLRKGMLSVVTKIMQQVVVKLGGSLWSVTIPYKNPMMICGFDTYHDSSAKGKSMGGFVASIDRDYTKFYSRAFQHEARGELSHFLLFSLAEAIKTFHSRNGVLPETILFYRDGVADNQLKAVHDREVPQILDVAKQFGGDYRPKVAVIVVQKRIRPRFFAIPQRGAPENPLPGTIVDNTITNPKSFDFFVISQAVRQGTVTPTRYNVIHDETVFKPDHHHQLAYRLSHLYFNWPGTIRVVAPCHYAHKLAFLTGQHVHSDAHNNLKTRLYFL